MSDDLATWLRAQLDEDERDANRRDFHTGMCLQFFDPGGDCSCDYSNFVLVDVEVKRRVLDWHEAALAGVKRHPDDLANKGWLLAMVKVVKLVALPYADRPGYREEWRVPA